MQTRQIRLAKRPIGEPADTDFAVVEEELPPVGPDEVLLRALYLSLDPYMRGRMSDAPSYAAPVEIGEVMIGGVVCEVLESRSDRVAVGDIVLSMLGWQTHGVLPASHVRRIDPSVAPVTTALGVLGMPGFTAYGGLLAIGDPQPGETVVVAAASGPVGSAVGQIARIKGARAVGIAGGPEKCAALLDEFGFDAAIDHRSPTFADDLAAATPDGVDVYFENVGGTVGAAVMRRLNTFARVPVCGLVADYNRTEAPEGPDRAPALMNRILTKRLRIRGFIQDEFVPTHMADFRREMPAWIAEGRVAYREDIVDGFDTTVEAFRGLLAGRNFGKLIVRVAEHPDH